ncbi:MAG: AbrB/MazE/SpoVT family DNA-binding domain-containing protein [Methanosphaera stadtmanae]|nr:AbrB/MazE/SpoVT family DNA-binding domain-containing protein [Methanosphaera stadtmanae]
MVVTKISKGYKITIPKDIRQSICISESDDIEWIINERNNIEIIPKKKSMMDIIGIISDEDLDAVNECEKASRENY